MKIRPAQVEDAPAMGRVIVDTFMASNQGILSEEALQRRRQEWTREDSARNWERALRQIAGEESPRECIFVAEDENGEVVGLAMGSPASYEREKNEEVEPTGEEAPREENIGEVTVLYVLPSHQGQGIGRALVMATAAQLARWEMTKLRIYTLSANVAGRRFYEKIGGIVVGTVNDVGEGEVIPMVVYEWAQIQTLS